MFYVEVFIAIICAHIHILCGKHLKEITNLDEKKKSDELMNKAITRIIRWSVRYYQ